MGPIGHIIQIVVPTAGIVSFVLPQQRGDRSGVVRITGAIGRMDGRVRTDTVKPMIPMPEILGPVPPPGLMARLPCSM